MTSAIRLNCTGPVQRAAFSYHHSGSEYQQSFDMFLRYTDQKLRAAAFLRSLFQDYFGGRPQVLDAGCGDGTLTSMYLASTTNVFGVDKNPFMVSSARSRLTSQPILHERIESCSLPRAFDAVVCGHVLFHVDYGQWWSFVTHLASFVREGGIIALLLQNCLTPYMKILRHLELGPPSLLQLAPYARRSRGLQLLSLGTLQSSINCENRNDFYTMGEFMLNCVDGWDQVESDLWWRLASKMRDERNPGFSFSCNQDYLILKVGSRKAFN